MVLVIYRIIDRFPRIFKWAIIIVLAVSLSESSKVCKDVQPFLFSGEKMFFLKVCSGYIKYFFSILRDK